MTGDTLSAKLREAADAYASEGGYDANPRYERDAFVAGAEWAIERLSAEPSEAMARLLEPDDAIKSAAIEG
jgi:hypothetical protein